MQWQRTIAPEFIACVTDGRAPSLSEFNRVAERIDADLQTARAPSCDTRSAADKRLLVLKAAHTALIGDDTHAA